MMEVVLMYVTGLMGWQHVWQHVRMKGVVLMVVTSPGLMGWQNAW
jgi:hypothetical protein